MFVQIYSASLSAAQDLIEITAPADSVVWVTNARVSKYGDATSENVRVQIARVSTSGSGGSTGTPASKLDPNDTAGAATEIGNTTGASPGAVLLDEGFNLVSGFKELPVPDGRIRVEPGDGLVLRLASAPGAARNIVAMLEWFEG